MSARKRMAQGFTLVEILIVVVILGILAAIVIPQFSNASETARASNLLSQLQTLRSQLELAQVQHQGVYPPLAGMWGNMTGETEGDTAYTAGDASGDEFGPYLQKAPVNPFAPAAVNSDSIGADETASAWAYDEATGRIMAVVDLTRADADNLGLTATDVVATGETF